MPSYGYRLYQVWVRQGDGRKDKSFTKAEDGNPSFSFVDYLYDLLEAHIDRREQGKPHQPIDVEAIKDPDARAEAEAAEARRLEKRSKLPVFLVTEVQRVGSHLAFVVRYGAPGDHDKATSPDGPDGDKDIDGLPPTRTYRALLIGPNSGKDEDYGILAVEAIGRACPAPYILMWTRYWARQQAEAAPRDGGALPTWWKMRAVPVGDDETLRSYLQRATPQTVQLTRHAEGTDNRRNYTDLKLIADVGTDAATRELRKLLKQWERADAANEEVSVTDAAASVAAVVGSELEDLDFDAVSISLEDDELGRRTITPNDMSDVFTYRHPDGLSPDRDTFQARVRSSVSRLHIKQKPHYDWTGWPRARR